jgi:large subunit ribosomal protein L2
VAVRKYKPTSPGRRDMMVADFANVTRKKPERSLTTGITKTGGRNNAGRITSYQRGGGHKRRYRQIDFRRDKWDIPAKVASIEYDPNRSARIALLQYADGEKRYIIAPVGLGIGDEVRTSQSAEIQPGNAMSLRSMPLGTVVHNVEFKPGKGGQMCRSAGTGARLMAREGKYATLKLPSGETRRVLSECLATIGQVGNLDHENVRDGKAGRVRSRPKATRRGRTRRPTSTSSDDGEPSRWRAR